MAEDEVQDPAPAGDDEAEIEAEVAQIAGDAPKSREEKLRGAVIERTRLARAQKKEIATLKAQNAAQAARQAEIDGQLERVSPVVNAILNNPRLKAEALRASGQTRSSSESTEQPDNDPDAEEFAEANGYYLSDGATVDVARGRRVLTIMDRRNGRNIQEGLRPLAGVTLSRVASENYNRALTATDSEGVPLMSKKALDEVWSKVPDHLRADQAVVEILINSAMGIDARAGTRPKAPTESAWLERPGARRAPAGLSAEDKARAKSLGVAEAEVAMVNKGLAEGRSIIFED